MKFGVHFARLRPSMWLDIAELCDELGFESVWLPEHLILPVESHGSPHAGESHPPIPADIPVFDVFVMHAAIAARTSNVRLGTSVYNIGLRHPFVTARAVSTLDVVSNGRVELGIGSSWLAEEWEAVGLDFGTRGARVDEAITVCRRLWTESEVSHAGEHFKFEPVMFEPKPPQQPLPITVGGDGPRAWRRVAELGDGWIPMNTAFDDLPAARREIEQRRRDLNRDPAFTLTAMLPVESADDVRRYEQAGVDRVIVAPWQRSGEAADALRTFAAAHVRYSR